MIRFAIVAALAAVSLAGAAVAQPSLSLPDRLGPLVRTGGAEGPVTATYEDAPGGPGTAIATLFVRPLGRSAADDMAASEAPLRQLSGVTTPGPLLTPPAGCPDVIARIDPGSLRGTPTLTASLYALRDGQNIKLRVTVPASRGAAVVAAVLGSFRTGVLGCAS